MRQIDKDFVLELYALHNGLAAAVIAITSGYITTRELQQTLEQADRLADQLETKFAEVLTPDERGLSEPE